MLPQARHLVTNLAMLAHREQRNRRRRKQVKNKPREGSGEVKRTMVVVGRVCVRHKGGGDWKVPRVKYRKHYYKHEYY